VTSRRSRRMLPHMASDGGYGECTMVLGAPRKASFIASAKQQVGTEVVAGWTPVEVTWREPACMHAGMNSHRRCRHQNDPDGEKVRRRSSVESRWLDVGYTSIDVASSESSSHADHV
jgi:hypothetical protein